MGGLVRPLRAVQEGQGFDVRGAGVHVIRGDARDGVTALREHGQRSLDLSRRGQRRERFGHG